MLNSTQLRPGPLNSGGSGKTHLGGNIDGSECERAGFSDDHAKNDEGAWPNHHVCRRCQMSRFSHFLRVVRGQPNQTWNLGQTREVPRKLKAVFQSRRLTRSTSRPRRRSVCLHGCSNSGCQVMKTEWLLDKNRIESSRQAAKGFFIQEATHQNYR